jgi:hypothetical protein
MEFAPYCFAMTPEVKRRLEAEAAEYKEDPEYLVISDDPDHPANLIPELCRVMYTLGWVTGTG